MTPARMGRINRLQERDSTSSVVSQINMAQVSKHSRRRRAANEATSSTNHFIVRNGLNGDATEAAMPTTPATESRVKSQERTPTGQHIPKHVMELKTETHVPERLDVTIAATQKFTDLNSNSIPETKNKNHDDRRKTGDVNSNSVSGSPSGRNLLKQLQTSLNPKLTTVILNENRRVSRYGRHQKQKENINYVPVELTKFVSKSPAKVKARKDAAIALRGEVRSELRNNENAVMDRVRESEALQSSSSKHELENGTHTEVEMTTGFTGLKTQHDDVLDMDAINIIGMNVSFENINDETIFSEDTFQKILCDGNHSFDMDSAKGSSIDLKCDHRAGEIYWGSQTQKTIHWPCIVRVDPITNQISRTRADAKMEIHVAFFGDRGRRGWIRETYMVPFNGLENYCSRVENWEFGKAVKTALKVALRQSWKQASQQAEECCSIEIGRRLEHFDMQVKLERMRMISNRTTKLSQPRGQKRHRSASPESPSYEAIPYVSENSKKKIRLKQKGNASPAYSENKGNETNEKVCTESAILGEQSHDYAELVYKLIVNIGRKFLLHDQATGECAVLLQQYARKISLLKNECYQQKSKRTTVLRELCQLRKLCQMIDDFKAEKGDYSGASSVLRIKKEKLTLEEEFVFESDPKSIMKGVAKGFVCYKCERPKNVVKCIKCQRHMHLFCETADPLKQLDLQTLADKKRFNCTECTGDLKDIQQQQKCFVCNDEYDEIKNEPKYRCTGSLCYRQYHLPCLRLFPQFTELDTKTIICPYHVCHTCVADDPSGTASTAKAMLVRCVKCPSSYHPDMGCIPAGSELLTTQQMICPKHSLDQITLNVNWCFLCCQGGDLICCETCPNSFHRDCLPCTVPEGKYFCEECESGRLPLYNEIVIAKLGNFRWWPALIVPPSEISMNLLQQRPHLSSICVKFFQSRTVAWLNRRRMYLYQHDDSENLGARKSGSLDKQYRIAMAEASRIYKLIQSMKSSQRAQITYKPTTAPPTYQKIKTNRYVAPLKQPQSTGDSTCYCHPNDEDPCGPNSSCINRAIMIECIGKTCPAKERCSNQRFAKRLYPKLEVHHFAEKGYGLVAKETIECGQFIIEYVGEVIKMDEFHRRIKAIQERQIKNYYFLTAEGGMTIDAGTKGNVSRFINHSCDPNCETQKWSIGNTPVIGLFAIKDIQPGEELTFNYNLESLGNKKRVCLCGAVKCSGFIGEKYRPLTEVSEKSNTRHTFKRSRKIMATSKAKKTVHSQTKQKDNVKDNAVNPVDSEDVVIVPEAERETIDLDNVNIDELQLPIRIKKEKVAYDS